MADTEEHKAQAASETETPAHFLENLGKVLREKGNIDVDLVDILVTDLLNVSPAADAVAKAKASILKLASDRANAMKLE